MQKRPRGSSRGLSLALGSTDGCGPGGLQKTGVVVGVVTLAMEEEGILNNQENASSSEVPSLTVPPRDKGTVLKVGGPEMGVGGPAVDSGWFNSERKQTPHCLEQLRTQGPEPRAKAPFCLLQIMAERKNAKALACSSLQERAHGNLDVPLQGRSARSALVLARHLGVARRGVSDTCPSEPRGTHQTRAEPALGASGAA